MVKASVNADAAARKRVGTLLAALRRRRGITRAAFIERSGLSNGTLKNLETGVRLRRQTIHRIADALELPYLVLDMVLMTHGYVPTEASLRRMVAADRAMSERP